MASQVTLRIPVAIEADAAFMVATSALDGVLADLREALAVAYGVGTKPPGPGDVVWQVGRTPTGQHAIVFIMGLMLVDGGKALDAELKRRTAARQILAEAGRRAAAEG
jgi:hypothetical protein